MATKKKKPARKAQAKKVAKKRKQPRPQAKPVKSQELIIRVDTTPQVPTVTDLAEPMKDGVKLTMQPTWIGENQLLKMLQRTPREQVYRRKGRGKDTFDYVTGTYCIKWLNFVFGWNWDFEVIEHGTNTKGTQVWALGKLTVRGNKAGQVITKTGFGRSDVKQLRESGGDLDYGNDLKAASTDAMKKAASLLGFASDIYGKMDYKQESGRDALPPADPQQRGPAVSHEEPVIQIQDKVCLETVGKGVCGVDITNQEAEYSMRMTGQELCRNHLKARQGKK